MDNTSLIMKEDGNNLFRDGKFENAICKYTEALKITEGENDRAVIHRNRAACHLKLSLFHEAIDDATAALDICSTDTKALFRRCLAYESLGKVEEGFKDAMKLLNAEPKNTAIQPILGRLSKQVQDKAKQQETTENKVQQMLQFSDETADAERRLQAVNNLVVLSRDEPGIQKILANDGLDRLKILLNSTNAEVQLAAIRVLSNIAKSHRERGFLIYEVFNLRVLTTIMTKSNAELANGIASLLQSIMNSITGIVEFREKREKYEEEKRKDRNPRKPFPNFTMEAPVKEVADAIFLQLLQMLSDKKVSAQGRDSALELLLKNISRLNDLGWTREFMDNEGIENTLTVAGRVTEHGTLPTTDQTSMHTSLLLAKVYDDLNGDNERELFRNNCNKYLVDMLSDEQMESKLGAVVAICALLRGPFDVGNSILGREGILQMMLSMAHSENDRYQRAAVEALVLSASKKDKCSGLIKEAVPILKSLYSAKTDAIRVRALVGLCKLGSFGGTDASAKSFADGSTVKLAKACRKFLNNPDRDVDVRKWATEGMAYLTLDADVKEDLVNDDQALQSIMNLACTSDQFILYPATQIFVNLTNSYDKQDVMPEMLEIAKYAKQHIPEEHEKDCSEFVLERINKLVKAGVCSALVGLCKTDSQNSRELLARVFLAIVSELSHRGICVQQGGAKSLISLALEGTVEGKSRAAQALAKIAVTMNPQFAFPGQRSLEVIRPLVQLLDYERTGLQNFEALMALTNLSSMNDSVRRRILREDPGLCLINHWMFEEHEYIRRAATQCICNMVLNEEVQQIYRRDTERLKLAFLYCGEEDDLELVKAASGAVATLTSCPDICKAIVEFRPWIDILKFLLVCEDIQIVQRGAYIVNNLMDKSEELAKKIVDSEIFELLMAISKLPEKKHAHEYANEALAKAVQWKLIQPATS